MQRMICIPSDQYNRMLESYDKAMEELQELREQLRTVQGEKDGVVPGQAEAVAKEFQLHRAQSGPKVKEGLQNAEIEIYKNEILSLTLGTEDMEYLQGVYSFAYYYQPGEVAELRRRKVDKDEQRRIEMANQIIKVLLGMDQKTVRHMYFTILGMIGRAL